jgi:hypothetical protein
MKTTELPRTKVLTAEWLLENFPNMLDAEGARIIAAMDTGTGNFSARESALQEFAEQTYDLGIVAIRQHGEGINGYGIQRYYGRVRFCYANSGDSYLPELYHDNWNQEWIASDYAGVLDAENGRGKDWTIDYHG